MKQSYHIHALHLQDSTKKILWHQQLGHHCDKWLYNYHKYIYGVPKFIDNTYRVLDQCTNWIQYKMHKTPTDHGNTRVATQPYQGLSIDLPFSRITSDDSNRKNYYEGINGQTWWILITNHFTGMNNGYAIHLLLPFSNISSTSIPILLTKNKSTWIKGVRFSITQM